MQAMCYRRYGGPEVLRLETCGRTHPSALEGCSGSGTYPPLAQRLADMYLLVSRPCCG